MSEPLFAKSWMVVFRRRLRAWFARHARDLPWRRTRDPYAIWVSEVMLQQTQVATVVDYYRRFMQAFPSVAELATADEAQVMRLWEGLGYYRRARHLHAAAREIVLEHGGTFPREAAAVRSLPGVGRYTAGAVLSIAFDAREPIVEANTHRLLSRLLADRADRQGAVSAEMLWSAAGELLPQRGAGAFNQALMELGSVICTPRLSRCEECPVAELCAARRLGMQESIPPAKRRPQSKAVHEVLVVVHRHGRVLLRRCAEQGRWAGLWDFVRFVRPSVETIESAVLAETGLTVRVGERIHTLKHGVTRYRITLDCYLAAYVRGRSSGRPSNKRWVRPAELRAFPLSTTGRKVAERLAGLALATK